MPPTRFAAAALLALAAVLAIAGSALAQDGDEADEVDNVPTLSIRDGEGNLVTEEVPEGELAVSASWFNPGNATRAKLLVEALIDGVVAWSGESSFLSVPANDLGAFTVPVETLAPGRYLFRAYVEVEDGDLVPTEETRVEVQASAVAPLPLEEEGGGFSGLMVVLIGAVVVTAAGVGIGIYDRSLLTQKKPMLSDSIILVAGLLGCLGGMLVAFKVTKHPERHAEKPVWMILGLQVLILAVVVWLVL